jgi:N-acetylglutamate synthase
MPVVLEPSWLGRRVSVRRVLDHIAPGPPQFGDVVGDLIGLDAQTAVVDTRGGPVEVALERIAVAKLVPPSTADELAVEAVAARGLRPAEEHALGRWTLRANFGVVWRANSVLPLGRPEPSLDAALAFAHDWYAERGLPLRVQVPTAARRLLDAELGERGWHAEGRVSVRVARLDSLRPPTADAPPVRIAGTPDDDWLALCRGGQGLAAPLRGLLTRHDDAAFASVRLDGRTVAIGRGAVDDRWLGVTAVEVRPEYRRRGLASAVMAALWRWGTARGAQRSYLQVSADNDPAVALYGTLGYWGHHEYHYRIEPGP